MKCPRKDCTNEARKHPVFGILPCKKCQTEDPRITFTASEPIPTSRLHRIQAQRDQHAKDMLQPFDGDRANPDFVRAYPELVESYFTKEQLAKSDV